MAIGDAYIDVHANTTPFNRELTSNLDRIADDAEGELNKTGESMGDDISHGISTQLKRKGKTFAKAIQDGTKNTVIRVGSVLRFDRIRDAIRRRFRRDVGDSIAEEIGDAFDRAGRRGGVFSRFGQGIADAIGAGFNVSGRSPLIAILIPALAALVGVIGAALQAVNALVAVLYIIPGLIASIALQVGVVAIAFQGVGKAVQGAFAAKNTKELRLALQGLTPSAKSFVKELLKLRPLFKEIGRTVQERFFNQIAGVVTGIRKALGPSLISGFGAVAAAAGKFLRDFGELLSSPTFVKFFNTLIPATVRWLQKLSPSLFGRRGFLAALLTMATELMPFMEKFGDIILNNLSRLSGLIFQLTTNPATQKWLDDMAITLQLVFDLLFKVGEFLFVFLARLNEAGGAVLISTLMEALSQLMFFLSSPVGLKGMEGLVNLGIIGIKIFTGLIELVFLLLAYWQFMAEWLKDSFVPGFISVMKQVGSWIVYGATFIGTWIERIVRNLNNWAMNIRAFFKGIGESVFGLAARALLEIRKLIDRLRGFPGNINALFRNIGTLLVQAGRNLIQGLINGINQKVGALRAAVSTLMNILGRFLPGSPAKEGPLSGRGYTMLRGQRMMEDFIEGIRSEIPNLRSLTRSVVSNVNFGSNSVQVNIAGEAPDTNRARSAGSAMGMAAANMIAARNTRLAVRTL